MSLLYNITFPFTGPLHHRSLFLLLNEAVLLVLVVCVSGRGRGISRVAFSSPLFCWFFPGIDCKTDGFFLKIIKKKGKVWSHSLFLALFQRSRPFVWLLARAWIRKNTDCFAVYPRHSSPHFVFVLQQGVAPITNLISHGHSYTQKFTIPHNICSLYGDSYANRKSSIKPPGGLFISSSFERGA